MTRMSPTMPFGKYAGEPIEDVPTEYLEWACETWNFATSDRKALLAEMEAQIALRSGEGVVRRRGRP